MRYELMGNDEIILTPGGWRPKSKVHLVEPGQHVEVQENVLKIIKTDTGDVIKTNVGKVIKDLDEVDPSSNGSRVKIAEDKESVNGPKTNGWIINTEWTNSSNPPVSVFSASWIVPPEPATKNGQTIFLFDGIQQNNNGPYILQPVLQWGPSAAGGGAYWSIASWYVDGQGGTALHSKLIPVNSGEYLHGNMSLVRSTNNQFDYYCSFYGYPDANLFVNNIDELHWANITLECYNFKAFTDYPDTEFTEFNRLEIHKDNDQATLNWLADNRVTDNGQHCDIISNASPNGTVRLYYKT